MITDEDISGKALDHLGLVAATIEKIGLIAKIDQRLPLENPKTTMGQRVAAMIFNGLGFIDDRLYMFPEFLHNKPVDRLFTGNVKAENFNDDALGRCLDAIYAYGVTKFFSEVAFEIGTEQKLLGRTFNIDTTSLTVYGDYAEEAEEVPDVPTEKIESSAFSPDASAGAVPCHGYSKDHRPDLKQMVLNLATTGSAGFPIWMEAHSGNASDKKILHEAAERMRIFCKELKEAPAFMTVGDSAIYEACVKHGGDMLWLTRVSEQHKAIKELVQHPDEVYNWSELADGYKICVSETQYQGIHQRWAVVFSEQAQTRELKTLTKRIQETQEKLEKALWHLGNQVFQCKKDAQNAADVFAKKVSFHQVSVTIEPVLQHKGKGRPSKDVQPSIVGYKIKGTLSQDAQKIAVLTNSKGRFVLATNQLDRDVLPDADILSEYKGQAKTESGFKFIKDDAFEVSSIFLKKPERIAALMMIMTLCLMVYALSQHAFRRALTAAQDTIPNQLKKETASPSMKWVYRLFHGVQVITLCLPEVSQEIVINLKAVQKKIIRYFGPRAMQIYGIT
jgi:transposase